ncbi:hypothetical protein FBQ97_15550, partial [Acidobacteria bacterium ACD]|nr:hypothetical protein [Acidobacteria bacterium ACD]
MNRRSTAGILLAAASLSLVAVFVGVPAVRAQQAKHPVYVGTKVCATCHEGKAAGNQYSHWLASKHARAYAALALPEAVTMAQLSGIPDPPEKAPVCLGCHATAAEAESWERDPTFVLEEGVQCEKCHGPGSEYASEAVMKDPEAARKAGLRVFTKRDCVVCHYVKGSHAAVHKLPQIDVEKAWAELAHPVPKGSHVEKAKATAPPPPPGPAAGKAGPRYVGARACEACHHGPAMGHQGSLWRLSAHARAYAALSTPAAAEIARILPKLVTDIRDKDRWSREELLRELGWRDPTKTLHIHRFPVGAYVQRNRDTEITLLAALRAVDQGYLSLVGPPGSGKS